MVSLREAAERLVEESGLADVADGMASGEYTVRESQADKLIKLALSSGAKFFNDQLGDTFCATHADGTEVLRLRSRAFRLWLRHSFWEAENKAPGGEAVENAVGHLEAKALFDGEEVHLDVRVAHRGDVLWYDLGEKAVKITPEGWEVVETPPILFKRFRATTPQVIPVRGGMLKEFLEFTRVKEDRDRLLFQTRIVTNFIPGFPHPIEAINGDQGAAKSMGQKFEKDLVDPSPTLTFAPPDNLREFIQQASHHWVIVLDNLSTLPGWLSDALCRLCTGEGFSKRELYSDDDDVIYVLQRVVGLNGINLVVEKSDLLDRAIILGLERVPDDERIEEIELWSRFKDAKPRILGGVFDTLSKAMAIYPNLKLKSLSRMADFARWGEAIAQALGYNADEFLTAYAGNVAAQNEAAIDASPVGQAIIDFMEKRKEWKGTPTELLGQLQEVAEKLKLDPKGKKWPKEPNWLWRLIKEVRPNLLALGIKAENKTEGKDRQITLTRVIVENAADAVDAVGTDSTGDGYADGTEAKEEYAVGARQIQNDGTNSNDSNSPQLSREVKRWTL